MPRLKGLNILRLLMVTVLLSIVTKFQSISLPTPTPHQMGKQERYLIVLICISLVKSLIFELFFLMPNRGDINIMFLLMAPIFIH